MAEQGWLDLGLPDTLLLPVADLLCNLQLALQPQPDTNTSMLEAAAAFRTLFAGLP